ncbi:probable E3 ubiquitin-protein ligase ZFP1 [Papaver somniferum]|uniref:probable E3 ubiquitin-protein ligase ZFP1 n=1 Tax=Papaver somniferum TaxID=3469 RepID=UPI000E6F51FB|nr:probable E3 ubiquitin-protein ligase ZFP1 [Papaver somniferum]
MEPFNLRVPAIYIQPMGQRNMLCTNQMLDIEMDQQGRGHFPSEPCIMLANIAEYPHPNAHQVLSVSGTTSNPDPHRMAGHQDSSLYFAPPYNGLQHRCSISNVDLSIAGPSSIYNPYMIHSSTGGIFPMSLNCSPSNHLPSQPSSSNHGVDIYESNQFMDCMRNSGKRKNAEGVVQENLLHLNGSASSSSSLPGTQLNTGPQQQEEQTETALSDDSASMAPEYRPNGLLTLAEESERSVRSRSNTISLQVAPSVAHNHNQLVQGTYMGHYFHPVSNSWVDQQFGNNARVGVSSAWNHGPAIPYLPGRNVNGGFSEIVSIGGPGYQEATTSRNSAILSHSHSMHRQVHNHHHHPPVPVQALRGHPSYQAQVPLPSYRQPMNNLLHHGPFHTSRDSQEAGPRHHPRPFPTNGLRFYRPHRSGVNQTGAEGRNSPHLRFLAADEVAILELPGYYEVGNFVDQHREMRLDIDDMSYEELLALGEQIGSVKTGLSEDTILRHLKTRIHISSSGGSYSMNRETETCIVCQIGYENQEKIGTLDCGHEYHVDCISKWLSVKNVCPICKTPALTGKGIIG